MTELLEVIYNYVQDESYKLCHCSREYLDNHHHSESHLDWLRANLTPEALRHLEEGLDMRDMAGSEEQRALFRAALSAGVSLGALGQLAE